MLSKRVTILNDDTLKEGIENAADTAEQAHVAINGLPLYWESDIATVTEANAYPVIVNGLHISDKEDRRLYWDTTAYQIVDGVLDTPTYSIEETNYPVMDGDDEVLSGGIIDDLAEKANRDDVDAELSEVHDNYDTLRKDTEDGMGALSGDLADVSKQSKKNADDIESMSEQLDAATDYILRVAGKVQITDALLVGDRNGSNINIDGTTIAFRQKQTVMASMDNEQLNIETANVTYLKLGRYILENMSDGTLLLKER